MPNNDTHKGSGLTVGLWQMRICQDEIQFQAPKVRNRSMNFEKDIKPSLIEWFIGNHVWKCIKDKRRNHSVTFLLYIKKD